MEFKKEYLLDLLPNRMFLFSKYTVQQLLDTFIAGPVFPSTVLLALMVMWSLLTICIGFGMDVDFDSHVDGFFSMFSHTSFEAIGSVAMLPMRWLNMRNLPIMIWLGIFSFLWSFVSIVFWLGMDRVLFPQWGAFVDGMLVVRNLAVALPLTKLVTQPMTGWFASTKLESRTLIGEEAVISSYDATPEHGQVKFKTDGAPLLLNVRTDGPHLDKGTRVWITHFDPVKRVYTVSATTTFSPVSKDE